VKRWEVVETKVVPVVIGAKSTYDFNVTSTVNADDVTVSVTVK